MKIKLFTRIRRRLIFKIKEIILIKSSPVASKKVTNKVMDIPQTVAECLETLFEQCGEDPQREGLQKTPQRFLKAFKELTQGYRQTLEEVVNGALFACDNNAPVIIENIPFYSLCEHHLLPFFGHCTIAYVPNGKVLGVSKLYRIVNLFARRLQLQERLTQQIGESIREVTGAREVFVEMIGEHLCVAMRGVQRYASKMRTFYRFGESIDGFPRPSSLNASDFGCLCTKAEAVSGNVGGCNEKYDASLPGLLTVTTKEFPLQIGCYSEEQTRMTPVTLTFKLQLPQRYGIDDDLNSTVDYDALMTYLEKGVLQRQFQLLEYAGKEIYEAIQSFLQAHQKQAKVRVTLTKTLSRALLQDSRFTCGDF